MFMRALLSWKRNWGSAVLATISIGAGWLVAIVVVSAWIAFDSGPLPFRNGDRAYQATFHRAGIKPSSELTYVSARNVQAVVEQMGTTFAVLPFSAAVVAVNAGAAPHQRVVQSVSWRYFEVLGVPVARGRPIVPADSVAEEEHIAVISDRMWRRDFDGRDDILGATARFDSTSYRVVGVLPPLLNNPLDELDAFVPLGKRAWGSRADSTCCFGVLLGQVSETDIGTARHLLSQALASAGSVRGPLSAELRPFREVLRRRSIGVMLPAVLGIALGILAIAYVNFTILLLLKGLTHGRESMIKHALGASRFRLVVERAAEAQVLTLAAMLAALLAGRLASTAAPNLLSDFFPAWVKPAIDWRIVAFVVGSGLCLTAACTAISALDLWRTPSGARFRTWEQTGAFSRGAARSLYGLVFAELVLTATLVPLGLSYGGRVVQQASLHVGFEFGSIVELAVWPDNLGMLNATSAADLASRLVAAVKSLPGVSDVSDGQIVPWIGERRISVVSNDSAHAGRSLPVASAFLAFGSESLLRTLRAELLTGRLLSTMDATSGADIVVVSRSAAEQMFGSIASAIGASVTVDSLPGSGARPLVVVGVVSDIRLSLLHHLDGWPTVFTTVDAPPSVPRVLHLRVSDVTPPALAALRVGIVRAMPGARVSEPLALRSGFSSELGVLRRQFLVAGGLCTMFGILALAGVFGTASFVANVRRRDTAIRRALGASGSQVLSSLIGPLGWRTGMAVVIGIPAGVLLARATDDASSVHSVNSWLLVSGGAAMLAIAIAGTIRPAASALRDDPNRALRD